MNIFQIDNLFSDIELKIINDSINSLKKTDNENDSSLGRTFVLKLDVPDSIKEKINKVCSDFLGIDLVFTHVAYAEYNNLHGNPNLPPHYDNDGNVLVVDYQLKANTSWNLGVNLKSYPLQDNSALIFNANQHVHWRPHKIFKDDEYVKMLFFRVHDPKNNINHFYPDNNENNESIKEARRFRDSLS